MTKREERDTDSRVVLSYYLSVDERDKALIDAGLREVRDFDEVQNCKRNKIH